MWPQGRRQGQHMLTGAPTPSNLWCHLALQPYTLHTLTYCVGPHMLNSSEVHRCGGPATQCTRPCGTEQSYYDGS